MIVAVNGSCAGKALRFVNSADIVIAADDAQFYDPHTNCGLAAAEGALVPMRLKSLPRGIALRMAYLGEKFKLGAQRACELGMVTEVVPANKLMARATELEELIERNSPAATRGAVAGFWDAYAVIPYDKGKWYAHVYDQQARYIDGREGAAAWVEGREPVWSSLTT